jgi:hypothetical protein
MKLAVGRNVSEDTTPAIRRGFFLVGAWPGDRKTAQEKAKPAAAEALQGRRRRGGGDRGRAQGGEENEAERQERTQRTADRLPESCWRIPERRRWCRPKAALEGNKFLAMQEFRHRFPYDLIAGAVRHPETRTIFKVLNIQIDGCMREVLTYAP